MEFTRRFLAPLSVVLLAGVAVLGSSTAVLAHDEIKSSTPANQEQIDEPITEVTIDFGSAVGGVELALVGPDDTELPGDLVVVSDTIAKLQFPELSDQGEYLVRYLAEDNGHLLAGAIAFNYGDASTTGASTAIWIYFGVSALGILLLGAFFSIRRSRTLAAESLTGTATPV